MKKLLLNLIALFVCAQVVCFGQTNERPQAPSSPSDTSAQRPATASSAGGASNAAPAGLATELAEANRLSAEVVRLYQAGKYDEALPLATRALELREKSVGREDVIISASLNNLAVLYREKKKYDEAAQHLRRSLSILEKNYAGATTQIAEVLSMLAIVVYRKGDAAEAASLAERSLALREKSLGSEHEKVAESLYLLAQFRRARNEAIEASELFKRAIKIWKQKGSQFDSLVEEAQENHACMAYDYLFRHLGPGREKEHAEMREKFFPKRDEANSTASLDGVINGKAISKPPPAYPDIARRDRLSGPAVIKIMVDETGKVTEARPLCGRRDALAAAAYQAALKARFTPTLKDGKPVKVSGIINYNFYLQY